MELSVLIATTGVSLLLVAFFLNLINTVNQNNWLYLLLNLFGAALSCYASYMIDFLPFVILEGVWAAVAAVGIIRKMILV